MPSCIKASKNYKKKAALFFFIFLAAFNPASVLAQNYDELVHALRALKEAGPPPAGVTEKRAQVVSFWKTGKLIDDYTLERGEYARPIVDRLAVDLKEKKEVLYYALQFARAYRDSPPALDLHVGFYRYLLAINDSEERNEIAERALRGNWSWDTLRAEVRKITLQNKEFVFTATPGKTGVYRALKARRGPYRGGLVLDLGFGNEYKPEKINFQEYAIVRAECAGAPPGAAPSCVLHSDGGSITDLFTYRAEVLNVIDGDTIQAVIDLGFGITTAQTLRLSRLDAPEIYTKEGVRSKIALEEILRSRAILVRAFKMDKYGRYLADVWVSAHNKKEYVNRLLIDRGFAKATEP